VWAVKEFIAVEKIVLLSAIVLFFEAACWKSGVVENSAGRVGFVGLSRKKFNFS